VLRQSLNWTWTQPEQVPRGQLEGAVPRPRSQRTSPTTTSCSKAESSARPIEDPAWKRYEKQIADLIRERVVGPVKITTDAKITGRLSEVPWQIDMLIEASVSGIADVTIALDCKCFSKKVDVKDVEAFLNMIQDVGVNMGMLVTTVGFTPAAKRRATNIVQEVVPLVDIVLLTEATQWWMMRAGQSGRYEGDYIDHEPYGSFWWVVRFITGEPGEDEEDDVLWSSSDGGWDCRELGPRLLASLLARHRLARNTSEDELDNLTAAIRRNIRDGQGFSISTDEVDDWIAGFDDLNGDNST